MLNNISAAFSKGVKGSLHTRSWDKHEEHLFSLNESTALSRAKKVEGRLESHVRPV